MCLLFSPPAAQHTYSPRCTFPTPTGEHVTAASASPAGAALPSDAATSHTGLGGSQLRGTSAVLPLCPVHLQANPPTTPPKKKKRKTARLQPSNAYGNTAEGPVLLYYPSPIFQPTAAVPKGPFLRHAMPSPVQHWDQTSTGSLVDGSPKSSEPIPRTLWLRLICCR